MRFGLRNLLIAVSLVAIFFGGRAMVYAGEASGVVFRVQCLSGIMAGLVTLWIALSIQPVKKAIAIAAPTGAITATLVAGMLGVEIAEDVRRTTQYFDWRQDGLMFALLVLRQTVLGAVVGLVGSSCLAALLSPFSRKTPL